MGFQFFDAGVHEVLCDAFTMPVIDNVKPLNFTRRFGQNAVGCTVPAKLRKPNQPFFLPAQEGNHVRVGNFTVLDSLAVTGLTVEIHVLSRIHGAEGIPECYFSKLGELLCVAAIGFSNDGQKNLLKVAWRWSQAAV